MYTREQALERLRGDYQVNEVQIKLLLSNGDTPEQGAVRLDQLEAEILAEFERIKREQPELLDLDEGTRRFLEESAAERGRTFEYMHAHRVVFASRVKAGFRRMRQKGIKLTRADFPAADEPPPGLSDLPNDLLGDDLKSV